MNTFYWVSLTIIALGLWALAYLYSKRHYNFLACRACKGGGKIWEPIWMSWLCLRRRRAFRLCEACGGTARHARRGTR
jgi:hypothetical protein